MKWKKKHSTILATTIFTLILAFVAVATNYLSDTSAELPTTQLNGNLNMWENNITNASKIIDSYDVRYYGADGTDTTDDYTAFQLAADTLGNSSGGTLKAPPGAFYFSKDINLPSNVHLQGSGIGSTIFIAINYNQSESEPFKFTGRTNDVSVIASVNSNNVSVSGFTVDCNDSYVGGVSLIGGSDLTIESVKAMNCPNIGLQIGGKLDNNTNPATSSAYNNISAQNAKIINSYAERTLWGFVIDGSCIDCAIVNSMSTDAVRRHISIDVDGGYDTENSTGIISGNLLSGSIPAPTNWQSYPSQYAQAGAIGNSGNYVLQGNKIRGWAAQTVVGGSVDYAIKFNPGARIILFGNSIEGEPGELIDRCIDLDTSADGSVIESNFFRYCTTGIRVRGGGGGVSIIGNRIIDSTTPMSISATDRFPQQNATVIKDNYDEDGIVDPGYAIITVTIPDGSTSANGNHALSILPSMRNIKVIPTSSLVNATYWWVSSLTTSNVQISIDQDPDASVTFDVIVDARSAYP